MYCGDDGEKMMYICSKVISKAEHTSTQVCESLRNNEHFFHYFFLCCANRFRFLRIVCHMSGRWKRAPGKSESAQRSAGDYRYR